MRSDAFSRSFRLVLRLAVLFLLVPCAASAQRERQVAREVHEAGGYADRLPLSGERTSERGELQQGGAPRERGPSVRVPPGAPAAATGFSYVVIAIAIVLVVALLFFIIASVRPRDGPSAATAKAREPKKKIEDPIEVPLGDPDSLARAGRFDEAIAAALVQGLMAVGWKPEGLGKSRTAREILASVRGDEKLEGLVTIEERVAFAGEPATADRWAEARPLWIAITERAR